MSWKDCAAAIRTAAGRDLSDDQVADIFEAVDRRRRAIEASGKIDALDQRVTQAAAEVADTVRLEAALARKHAAMSVIARDRVTRQVEAHVDAGMSYRRAVLAVFEGTTRGITDGRKSVAATKIAYDAKFVGGMMADIARDVPHAERMLRDREFLDDVVREMVELREGGQPDRTGNTDARKVAAIFADHAERSRQDLNRLGANVGKLDGWAGAQVHDADKIARVTPEEWARAVLPKLDLERTFPDATGPEVDRALRNIWENIVFQPERMAAEEPSGVKRPYNVARALERHRVLHFKSADDWLAYSRDFGHGHIFDGMVAHQSRAALNAAQMEILGPNPGATLDGVLDALRRRVDVDDRIAPADKAAEKAKLADDPGTAIGIAHRIASGAAMIPRSQTMADVGGTIRAIQAMAKLGGAVISSITDLPTAVVNLRFNGMSFGEAISGQIGEFLKGRGKAEQRELAYLLGEGFDGVIGHIVSPWVAADSAPGAMQSAMTTFFRWSGLTWWTDANRAAAARVLSAHLGRQADTAWDGLPDRLRNVLNVHGIDDAVWDTIRILGRREIDGRTYIVPGFVDRVPETGAARTIPAHEQMRDADLALRRYFADEAQSSVLEADAATQRFTTGGLQRGTVAGEAIRFVMQFKAFPIAFTQRVLGRAALGAEGGSHAGVAHIGTLLAGLTVLGYAAMSAKDAIRGYEPREFLETLAGPAAGDAARFITLWQRARNGEASGADGLTAVIATTPFANLFWARPVVDYLALNELRETLSPGYLARQDQRRRKDFGQDPLVAPSDRMALDLF